MERAQRDAARGCWARLPARPAGEVRPVQLPGAGTLGRAAAPGGGRGGAAAPSPSGSRTQPQPAPLGRSAARSPERCHGAEAAPGPGRGGLAAAAALRAAPRRRRHQPRPGRSASGAGAGPGGSAGRGGRWCRSWDRGTGAREARGRAVRCVGPRAGWEAGRAAAPRLLRARALLPAGSPRAPPVGPRAAAGAAGLVFRCRAGLRVRGRCRWQLPGLCRGRRVPRVLGAPASREEPLAEPVRTSPGVPVPGPLSCPSLAGRGGGWLVAVPLRAVLVTELCPCCSETAHFGQAGGSGVQHAVLVGGQREVPRQR